MNFKLASRFVKFYIKLYKMLHNKIVIDSVEDLSEFKSILQTFELSMSVFKPSKIFLIKNMIRFWPTAYNYQVEVIKTFIGVCKRKQSNMADTFENEWC